MLITNKVKLISIDRQFTRGAVAMANSFFGRTCYERCVRSCYVRKNALKIPINTGNFTKRKFISRHFQQFCLEYNQIIRTL